MATASELDAAALAGRRAREQWRIKEIMSSPGSSFASPASRPSPASTARLTCLGGVARDHCSSLQSDALERQRISLSDAGMYPAMAPGDEFTTMLAPADESSTDAGSSGAWASRCGTAKGDKITSPPPTAMKAKAAKVEVTAMASAAGSKTELLAWRESAPVIGRIEYRVM